MRPAVGVLAVALALGGGAAWLLNRSPEGAGDPAQRAGAGSARTTPAATPDLAAPPPVPLPPPAAGDGADAPHADPARAAQRAAIDRLRTAALEAAATEDEVARAAARDRMARERNALIEILRRDPVASNALLDEALAAPPAEALALAVVLRHVPDPALATRLAGTLSGAQEPHARQAAIVALEGRDGALWVAPVRAAFERDAASAVRETAAHVLSRALVDPLQAAHRPALRTTLLAGLADADPAQRARAAEALAMDRGGPSEVRDRLGELAERDPDVRVRAVASSALRVLTRASSANPPGGG